MVTIEELKLGNRTLEALKFLLSQITELETAISQVDITEIKRTNALTKEQIATLQDVRNAVEMISSDLSLKKSDFDEKKQIFDINMSAFINDKADFDKKKADFDSKNNTALSNFAFISDNVEKINSTSALLAEAKAILEAIKPIEQRTQAALDTIANSQAKFDELDALKTSLLELKRSLENISTTGLITDTKVSTTQTYSSKKIEDLVSNAKTTLTADIKSKTDSLTTVMNNQKQSITTLDSKINTTQNNLNNLATSVSGALSQKVDTTAYNTFATKVTNDLSNKANKNDIPSIDSLAETFLKIKDKIDAYTKRESDDKFALKTSLPALATETKAGITKLKNIINAKAEDTAVTEKAVSEFVNSSQKGLGVGQTYVDVKNIKRINENYENTTGKPIAVFVEVNPQTASYILANVNDVVVAGTGTGTGGQYTNTAMTFIVPPGARYKLTNTYNSKIEKWFELR